MKLVYAAAALALAISPIAAVQSAAPAQAAPAVAQAGPPVLRRLVGELTSPSGCAIAMGSLADPGSV